MIGVQWPLVQKNLGYAKPRNDQPTKRPTDKLKSIGWIGLPTSFIFSLFRITVRANLLNMLIVSIFYFFYFINIVSVGKAGVVPFFFALPLACKKERKKILSYIFVSTVLFFKWCFSTFQYMPRRTINIMCAEKERNGLSI